MRYKVKTKVVFTYEHTVEEFGPDRARLEVQRQVDAAITNGISPINYDGVRLAKVKVKRIGKAKEAK